MKVLVIYEEVPETIALYIIDMTEETYEYYKAINFNYINKDIVGVCDIINELYATYIENYEIRKDVQLVTNTKLPYPVEHIILTGIYL
jgi:hypothetical protein